jgi:hypothetical protein
MIYRLFQALCSIIKETAQKVKAAQIQKMQRRTVPAKRVLFFRTPA